MTIPRLYVAPRQSVPMTVHEVRVHWQQAAVEAQFKKRLYSPI